MKAGIITTLVACAAGCVAGVASAADPTDSSYFEASYAFPNISFSGLSFSQNQLVARGGYNFNRNFGAEVMGAAGLSSGDINGVTLKVDSAYGIYLKGQVEVAPQFELFARAGWAHITLSSNVVSGTGGDSSFSYGGGVQYRFNKNWYLQGEYTSLYDKDGVTINGAAVGVGYRF